MSTTSRKPVLLSALVFLSLLITGLVAWPRADAGQVEADRRLGQDKRANKVQDERASPSNNRTQAPSDSLS